MEMEKEDCLTVHQHHLPTHSPCHSIMVEIPIEVTEVAPIRVSSQHRIAKELSHTCQFLPTAFPARICYGQVEEFQCPSERLFTSLRIFPFPADHAPDLTANIG